MYLDVWMKRLNYDPAATVDDGSCTYGCDEKYVVTVDLVPVGGRLRFLGKLLTLQELIFLAGGAPITVDDNVSISHV